MSKISTGHIGNVKHDISCPEQSYTGEGSAGFEKLEKPVWRPKGRQLNKFRSMLCNIIKQIAGFH